MLAMPTYKKQNEGESPLPHLSTAASFSKENSKYWAKTSTFLSDVLPT